jgi:hypothetical protein
MPPPSPVGQVIDACTSKPQQEFVAHVSFPNPGGQCKWEQDGNLSMLNGFFRARGEQMSDFTLPSGAILCSLTFSFPQQQFVFDDHFLFTFDGLVLASSYNYDSLLNDVDGFAVYDWSKIAGKEWYTGTVLEGQFCAGRDQNLSTCSWPNTEQTGAINMSFAPSIIQKIMSFDVARTTHSFSLVTVGDNDSTDCQHAPISFDLSVKYAQ